MVQRAHVADKANKLKEIIYSLDMARSVCDRRYMPGLYDALTERRSSLAYSYPGFISYHIFFATQLMKIGIV